MKGENYGFIAFWICAVLVVLGGVALVINAVTGNDIAGVTVAPVFTLAGVLFTSTWGAVAAKKFVDKTVNKE